MGTIANGDNRAPTIAKSRKAISSFIRRLIDSTQENYNVDRRGDERHPLSAALEVIPFDAGGHETGEGFLAVTRDVSADGISLIHVRPLLEQFLLLRFPESDNTEPGIVLEVMRHQQVGPFWIIAGRFLSEG